MKEIDVRTIVGEEHWDEFLKWMRGQTVGLNEDGSRDYYPWDVMQFCRGKGLPGNGEK